MTKLRVHEYAKKVNKSSKEVIEELKKLNITVSNHMSMLEGNDVVKLDAIFTKGAVSKTAQVKQERPQNKQVKNNQAQPNAQKNKKEQTNQSQNKSSNNDQRPTSQNQSQGEKKNKGNHNNKNMDQNNNTNNNTNNNQFRNSNKPSNTNNRNSNNNKGGFNNNQRRKPGIHGGKRRNPKPQQPPVVIKGELPDGDEVKENEIKKWNMIENYMDKLHYTETYNDGKFTVWQVAQ